MRVRVLVEAFIRPIEPVIFYNQASCPEELQPIAEAYMWWQPFPFITANKSGTDDHHPSEIQDSDIEDIILGLTSSDEQRVCQTAYKLARKHGLLHLDKHFEHFPVGARFSESISDWKALGHCISVFIEIRSALGTRNREHVLEALQQTTTTAQEFLGVLPSIGSTIGFKALKDEIIRRKTVKNKSELHQVKYATVGEILAKPKKYADDVVFDAALGAMSALALSLYPDGQTNLEARGLRPALHEFDGKPEFVLVSESFRGALSTYLLLALSADPTLSGADAGSGLVLPKLCANEACRLPFVPSRKGQLYGTTKSSCRVERKNSRACKYAREKLKPS